MPLVMMQNVQVESLDWLWPGRILFGKYNVLVGDGGIGKSTLMLDIAARLSRGLPMPDGTVHAACGTLLVMPEDGAGDTIRPRLENHGADLSRIGLIQTITDPTDGAELAPTIPEDITEIENAIIALGARFLVLDPLLQFMGENTNEYRDKDVRRAMAPLIAMCERLKVALVGLMHVTKGNSGNVKHRGNAATAFMNLSRSALYAAPDPDNPEAFILAQSKTNLGPMAASLRYNLVGQENGHARVKWVGESTHTAESLNAQGTSTEDRSELADAEDFLRDVLEGGPELYSTIIKLARAAGIAERTLRRAKTSLRIESKKARTQDGQWTWQLPEKKATKAPAEDVHSANPVALAPLDTLAIFQQQSEDVQDSQHSQDTGHKNAATFGAPLVSRTARYDCAACGRSQMMTAGRPQLCSACWSELVRRTGTEDD